MTVDAKGNVSKGEHCDKRVLKFGLETRPVPTSSRRHVKESSALKQPGILGPGKLHKFRRLFQVPKPKHTINIPEQHAEGALSEPGASAAQG
jgi:hypothetical protein